MERRTFLSLLAAPLRAETSAELTVLLDEEIGTISPLVYGQFTEHIGHLIYDGIWVGPDSKIPNRGGIRLDTLHALERIRPRVIRWPGGCFADTYHWEDGVGARTQRPIRRNHWWPRDEPNSFGTDEFLYFCEVTGANPYLTVNVGTGSLDEALNWLEYCNGTGRSSFAAMRGRNGHPRPYNVRYWGIGNENWGCGGEFTAFEYAQRFRQYAVYFKRMGMSQDVDLIGVGQAASGWNRRFLEAAGASLSYLDHLSIHRYFHRGHSTRFTDADYLNLMQDLTAFEDLIRETLVTITDVETRRARTGGAKRKPIGLAVDEWGVWHDDARLEDGYRQPGVLREALFAAGCLNLFHQFAGRITMTNIAQMVNCLQSLILTDGPDLVLTPTFHVYEMYRGHQGAKSVRVDTVRAPMLSNGQRGRSGISASASKSGGALLLTLVNQSAGDDAQVRITLRGGKPAEAIATNLTGDSVRAENTRERPRAVSPQPWKVDVDGATVVVHVPARSVQAIQILLG